MIYMDHNATTRCHPEAFEAMREAALVEYANPASVHDAGTRAAYLLESARARMALILGCQPDELIFTSGGSEANTLALSGRIDALRESGTARPRVICALTEHHAVLHPLERLERLGWIKVDWVQPRRLAEEIREHHDLAVLMLANNETGEVYDVAESAARARELGVSFHCDGVQAPGKLALDFAKLGVDSLALAAHKFGGPKGVGALIKRAGYELQPQILGGAQEGGMRAGTHNLPAICGMAKALEIAHEKLASEQKRLAAMRDDLRDGIQQSVPEVVVNGEGPFVCNTLNISLPGASGAEMVRALSDRGISASAGSACTASNQLVHSHVLLGLGYGEARTASSLRFSLGAETTQAEINEALPKIVDVLKSALPHE